MIVVGIDPGMGVKSPTAVVMFSDGIIFDYSLVTPGLLTKEREKIQYISTIVGYKIYTRLYAEQTENIKVCIEDFVMKGKGGQTLQRLIGAIISKLPTYCNTLHHCYNTTVKKHVGGHGRAEKDQVASGVLEWFKSVDASRALIEKWIKEERWDITDALAIGITGLEIGISS